MGPRVFATVAAGTLAGTASTLMIWGGDVTAGVFTGAAAASVVWNMFPDRVHEAIPENPILSQVRAAPESVDAGLPRTEELPTNANLHGTMGDTSDAATLQKNDHDVEAL